MLINRKLNKRSTNGVLKNIINKAFKALFISASIGLLGIGIFHFTVGDGFRLKVYQKLDYYFLPLESSYYTPKNISRLIKSYFIPLEEKNIISINSNFKNIGSFFNQLNDTENRSEDNNFNYSKGKLFYLGESVNIKYRPKGDRGIHYKVNKPSFQVKVQNSKSSIGGISEFSLQSPAIRNYIVELLWYELLKSEDIITPDYSFKKLILNGVDYGIYNIEERPSTFMLERLLKKNSSILKFDEAFTTSIDKNPEIRVVNSKDVDFKNQELAVSKLMGFVSGENSVSETFDVSKMATFFAISDLLQIRHGLFSKSARFYFNPFTQLLEPIPFDGHYFGKKFGDQKIYFSFNDTYAKDYYADNWLGKFFNKNNIEFYKEYYSKINYFSSKHFKAEILKNETLVSTINNQLDIIYKEIPLEDRADRVGPFIYLFEPFDFISENMERINAELNSKNVQFFFSEKNLSVYNKNESNNPIYINYLFSKDKRFNVNEFLIFDSENEIAEKIISVKDTIFLNAVTQNRELSVIYNDSIVKKVNLFKHAVFNPNNEINDATNEYLKLIGDEYSFKKNTTIISKQILIPENKTLKLSKGQKVIFDGGDLIVKGDLKFEGADNEKIIITTTKKGGKLIVLNGKHLIKNTEFINFKKNNSSNYYSGSITFYNSVVEFINSDFSSNESEDFLNLVSSDVKLNNIKFKDCFSDCLDLDFSNGTIEGLNIENSLNDGLDVSESILEIKDITITKSGDKGISVGENSKISIEKCQITNGDIGLVVKDGSRVFINLLETNNIKIPIAAFIKKERYAQPQLEIKTQNSINFEFKHLIQRGFNVTINNKEILGDSVDIESIFYGTQYGKKTIK